MIKIVLGLAIVLVAMILIISLCMAAKWADDQMDEMMEDSE